MESLMIEIKGLTKSFDGFCAIDNAAMNVAKGCVYGLVGPNGAGKTTLLKHLAGIYRADSGEVTLEGEPIYENPEVKERIIFIPDDLYYFMQADISTMMKFYKGLYRRFDCERFERLGQIFTGLSPKGTIRKMSKGMQKQAAFWVALCCSPDVILLDEPVDGLDPVMRRQVWSLLMDDVSQRGTTVVVSSHNLRELEDVCDHVGIMNHGKIMIERSLTDLQSNITKLQVVFNGDRPRLDESIKVLHEAVTGRIHTLIVKGCPEMIERRIMEYSPVFAEAMPLTLEEVFIYEMGGDDYAVREILF